MWLCTQTLTFPLLPQPTVNPLYAPKCSSNKDTLPDSHPKLLNLGTVTQASDMLALMRLCLAQQCLPQGCDMVCLTYPFSTSYGSGYGVIFPVMGGELTAKLTAGLHGAIVLCSDNNCMAPP
jgi:hypothetical protein